MKTLMLSLILMTACTMSFAQENVRILQRETVLDLKWGDGPGEVGIIRDSPYAFGPDSFLVDENGDIYLSDPVNHRMVVFNNKGEFVRNFSLIGYGETCWDNDGNICLNYYSEHIILKYSVNGNLLEKYEYELARSNSTAQDLYAWNGAYYILNSKFVPTTSFTEDSTGIRTYQTERVEIQKNDNPRLLGIYSNSRYIQENYESYIEKDNQKRRVFNGTDLSPNTSTSFLAEDRNNNKYFSVTHRADSQGILNRRTWEIWKLDSNLQHIATISLVSDPSNNNYYFDTSKSIFIDDNGIVYQLVTPISGINIYTWHE